MEKQVFVFGRKNYIWMLSGIALIIIGYILMAGGGSTDPEVFNPEIFSARRIVVAPIIILAGLLIEIYAIMNTGNSQNNG
jgi:drug/metabolite transporter (DMT)-like permease